MRVCIHLVIYTWAQDRILHMHAYKSVYIAVLYPSPIRDIESVLLNNLPIEIFAHALFLLVPYMSAAMLSSDSKSGPQVRLTYCMGIGLNSLQYGVLYLGSQNNTGLYIYGAIYIHVYISPILGAAI